MMFGDNFLNLVAVIIALCTLIVTVYVNREKFTFRLFGINLSGIILLLISITNLLIGVLVISTGFIIEPFMYVTFQSGIEEGLFYLFWRLGENLQSTLISGLFPGTVTAAVAMSSKTLPQKIRNSSFAAIMTLIIQDTIFCFNQEVNIGRFLFSVISDIIGGILAGIIISYLVVIIFNFAISQYDQKL